MASDSSRLAERLAGGAGQAWSERTDLQVQRMEQTIEQDLAKAMAGLREQFRQHPKFGPGSSEQAAEAAALQAQAQAQMGAAVLTDFRSEAAAARNEMLDGLARLRRELEVQRMQQNPSSTLTTASSSPGSDASRQLLQAAAVEQAVTDLRHGLSAQQLALADLRREVVAQLEFSKKDTAILEREMQRLTSELDLVRSHRLSGEVESQDAALLRQELQLLVGRLDQWEAERGQMLPASNSMDLAQLQADLDMMRSEIVALRAQSRSGAELEHTLQLSAEDLGRLREAVGGAPANAKVDPILETLELESQRRRADVEDLRHQVEDVQRTSLAHFQEIAEGLMLECTSRQNQIVDLRRSLAEDITASMEAAREALRADVVLQCRELREEIGQHLERELLLNKKNTPSKPQEGDIEARMAAIEFEVNKNLAAMGQEVERAESSLRSSMMNASSGDPEQARMASAPLISEGLKESLELLVDKVNRTLKTGPEEGAQVPAQPSMPLPLAAPEEMGHARGMSPQKPMQAPSPPGPAMLQNPSGSVSFPARPLAGSVVMQYPVPVNSQNSSFAPVRAFNGPAAASCTLPNGAQFVGASGVFRQNTAGPVQGIVPTVVIPSSDKSLAASTGVPGSSPADAPGFELPGVATEDSKDSFTRCLQELREENRLLREGMNQAGMTQAGKDVNMQASSVNFPVATPAYPMSQMTAVPVQKPPMVAAAQPVVMGAGGVGMTPASVFRTVSQNRRTLSPIPHSTHMSSVSVPMTQRTE